MAGIDNKHSIAFERHDHRHCQHQKTRLTRRRLQVLEILLRSHAPIRAYEILACLNAAESDAMIAPPIVYRALEFLLDEGLAHRIESRNAFISCARPGHGCEKVAELENSDAAVISEAASLGFSVDHAVVEISGHCAECQKHGS